MSSKTSAPDLTELRERLSRGDGERLAELLVADGLDDSQYLHWAQLARRRPPRDWSREEWWFALKVRRSRLLRKLPLHDRDGLHFGLSLTDEVLQLAREVERRASEALDAVDAPGLRPFLAEAIHSSRLEGASTPLPVAIDLLESEREPVDQSEAMILSTYRTMRFAGASTSQWISARLVRELHRMLIEGTDDIPQWMRTRSEQADAERAAHLRELCRFTNGTVDVVPYIPPVVRAIVIHFMFAYDRFCDTANGRLARMAFVWSMLRAGYPRSAFAALSAVLERSPEQYRQAFAYVADDEGDVTYFVLHQLRAFRTALDELEARLAAGAVDPLSARAPLR